VSLGNLPVQGRQRAGAEPGGGIVLCVDDDEGSCALMRAVLRDTPYRLLTAGSGEDALELLQQGLEAPPVLVLLDINLPGISGFELLSRLRMMPALDQIPVMAMSAGASPHQVARVREAGFSRFVEKPVMWEALEEVLPGIRSRFPGG
jgi:CheY-like chemotaxis protein